MEYLSKPVTWNKSYTVTVSYLTLPTRHHAKVGRSRSNHV